jgi:hypothetical protein
MMMNMIRAGIDAVSQIVPKMDLPQLRSSAADEVVEATSALAIRPKPLTEFNNAIVPSNYIDPNVIDVEVVDDAAEALVSNARKPQPYRFAKDNGLVNAEYAGTQPNAVSKAGTDGVVRIPESSITDAVPQTWGQSLEDAKKWAKANQRDALILTAAVMGTGGLATGVAVS